MPTDSLTPASDEPQGTADPGDPLRPEIEEEDDRTPPIGNPTADMELQDDDEAPQSEEIMDNMAEDNESELDDLDEAQFDNFDPETANITVPVPVDESNVGLLGVHKRKRVEGDESGRRKKKEGRREKRTKRVRAGGDESENDFEGGPEMDGKRIRKGDGAVRKQGRRPRTPENEDDLTPEERKFWDAL